jgi:hypothetical protein
MSQRVGAGVGMTHPPDERASESPQDARQGHTTVSLEEQAGRLARDISERIHMNEPNGQILTDEAVRWLGRLAELLAAAEARGRTAGRREGLEEAAKLTCLLCGGGQPVLYSEEKLDYYFQTPYYHVHATGAACRCDAGEIWAAAAADEPE